jgi:hypothetical protein
MNAILTGIRNNWHFMRIARLLFAFVMLASFITTGDKVGLFGAAFFGYQAIFNVGCCGNQACFTPPAQAKKHAPEIEYEEVKTQ